MSRGSPASAATRAPVRAAIEIPLVGPGGEPVDLWRVLLSHGVASLPPNDLDETARVLRTTVAIRGTRPRVVDIGRDRGRSASIKVYGRTSARALEELTSTVRFVLRLDEDLSRFYAQVADDPELSWITAGAGRMMRSQTVFEDVVKTICTTNCAWSATQRMVGALVDNLGEPAPRVASEAAPRRAFPTAEQMAMAGEDFYRDVARAGYRGRYLIALATAVADGSLDLEGLVRAAPEEIPDEELARRLQMLPGVGPYAAAHIMMMLGRYSLLILDSWTRPTYARLVGRKKVSDASIVRRFRRYGRFAGLAFWLYLTKDWVDEAPTNGDATREKNPT